MNLILHNYFASAAWGYRRRRYWNTVGENNDFSVSVRINIKDNLAGITYEVKPFVTDSGSAVNIRNISFVAAIGDFRNFSAVPAVRDMRHSAVCNAAGDNGRVDALCWQRLCAQPAAADFNLIYAPVRVDFYRLGARLPAVIARVGQSVIKNIPSAVYALYAAMCCACHIETVFFFATVKSDITC